MEWMKVINTIGFPSFCLIIIAVFCARLVKYITEDVHIHLKDIDTKLAEVKQTLEEKHNRAFQ